MEPRNRFAVIDIWVSLLLCLVIVGHCSVSGAPEYYGVIKTCIYSFHMASFYFVCGFLVRHSYRHLNNIEDYGKYILRRLVKFGFPLVGFGFLLCVAHVFLIQKGDLTSFCQNYGLVFYKTTSSPALYLWFIYVLFEFYLIAPLFCQFFKWSIVPALLIAVVLLFFPFPRFLNLHQFSRYLLFFLLGVSAREYLFSLKNFNWKWALLPAIAFPITIWNFPYSILPGLLSIPAFLLLGLGLSKSKWVCIACEFLSKNCFVIYLWQMIFVHLLAILLLHYLHLLFCFFLVLACPIAIAGSIWTNKLCASVLSKIGLFEFDGKQG